LEERSERRNGCGFQYLASAHLEEGDSAGLEWHKKANLGEGHRRDEETGMERMLWDAQPELALPFPSRLEKNNVLSRNRRMVVQGGGRELWIGPSPSSLNTSDPELGKEKNEMRTSSALRVPVRRRPHPHGEEGIKRPNPSPKEGSSFKCSVGGEKREKGSEENMTD